MMIRAVCACIDLPSFSHYQTAANRNSTNQFLAVLLPVWAQVRGSEKEIWCYNFGAHIAFYRLQAAYILQLSSFFLRPRREGEVVTVTSRYIRRNA